MRLLVVEDDAHVGAAISSSLRQDGHAVDWIRDGEEAEDVLRYQQYDTIIIDIGLPSLDGISILSKLRTRGDRTPVLMLTARSGIDDRIGALNLGADDYLSKPFDVREFQARCRSLLRRSQGGATDRIVIGKLCFDAVAKVVKIGDTQLVLPNREFRLLEILLRNQGRVMDKGVLAEQLFDFDSEAAPNAVEVYIGRLRKKLSGAIDIRTVRGHGYVADAAVNFGS